MISQHKHLDACLEFLDHLLNNTATTIREVAVEPFLPRPHDTSPSELHDTSSKRDSVFYLAYPTTGEDHTVDVLWHRTARTLALSTRLVLALYILLRHELGKLCRLTSFGTHTLLNSNVADQSRINLVTFLVLIFTGDHLGALSLRASLFQDSPKPLIVKELHLVKVLMRLHPKSHLLWMYRRFTLQRCGEQRLFLPKELELIQFHAHFTRHNYHPWVHWTWLMTFPSSYSTRVSRLSPQEGSPITLLDKITFLQKNMGLTPFHFAPYHHCYQVVQQVEKIPQAIHDTLNKCCSTLVEFYPKSEACWIFFSIWTLLQCDCMNESMMRILGSHRCIWRGWKPSNILLWKHYRDLCPSYTDEINEPMGESVCPKNSPMVNLFAAVGQLWTSVSWGDLPSSFHYTLGDTVALPFPSLFLLYRGTDNSTKDSVSIFVYSKTGNDSCVSNERKDTTCLAFIQNALKYSKTLRHPYIVRVLEAVETSTRVYIVTESVSPLCLCCHASLRSVSHDMNVDNKADPSWGLYRILNAIYFLHESCHVTHNLISPWSIFVTEKESQWCLGLFDGIYAIHKPESNVTALTHPLYNIYTESLPLATPGVFTLDRFRLACLVYWCYSKPHNTNLEKFVAVTHRPKARHSLPHMVDELCYSLYPYEHLKSLSLLKSIKVIVNESRVFRETGLVQIMLFFEECHLQPDFEKYAFFKNLPESLKSIDLAVQYENILPQLEKQIGLLKNPEALLSSIFYISENVKRKASDKSFQHVYDHSILPVLILLLKKPERGIRFFMLQHLNHFKDFLNSDHVEEIIEPICLGFHDSVPELRNATLESMLIFLPKLDKTKLQDKVFLHILNLLRHDTKPSIRVSALGCTLHLINSDCFSRHEKTLLSCILGALRDPISQCRLAALELLREWLRSPLCALDYTTLITPLLTAVTENCLDQDDMIKQRAIFTLEHLVKRAKHLLSAALSHSLGDASSVDQVVIHQSPSLDNGLGKMEKTKEKQDLACHHEMSRHQNSLSKLVMESNITDLNSGESSCDPKKKINLSMCLERKFSVGLDGIDQVAQSNIVNISPKYTEESEQFFDAEDNLEIPSTPPGLTNMTTSYMNSPQETCREEGNNSFSPQEKQHESTAHPLSDKSLLKLADLNKSFWKNCPVTNEKSTSENVNPTVNAVKQLIAARKNI